VSAAALVAKDGKADANVGTTHEAVSDLTKSLLWNGIVIKLLFKAKE
jgi:hypothetical protein